MAFLTYRQSDSSVTEAQHTSQNIIKGSPLTYYEIDANFKSLNDELQSYRTKFGVGVSNGDEQQSILSSFGSKDLNLIESTGFYFVDTNFLNKPSQLTYNSVILHIERADSAPTAVCGFQIIPTKTNVFYRTRVGTATWSDWNSIVNTNEQTASLAQLQAQIDQCMKMSGGTFVGPITVNRVNFNNDLNIICENSVKGSIPATDTFDGLCFYDTNGITSNNRLGLLGLFQTQTGTSGITLSVNDPSIIDSEQPTKVELGWKLDSQGSYFPYFLTPTPYTTPDEEPNLAATIGWVSTYVAQVIDDFNIFDATVGGEIGNTITVSGSVICDDVRALVGEFSQNVVAHHDLIAPLSYAKSSTPSTASGTVGNGLVITDASKNTKDFGVLARFYGTLTPAGETAAEMTVVNWGTEDPTEVIDDKNHKASIRIISSATGDVRTEAPTPPLNDNSTQIATTSWVRSQTALDVANLIANLRPADFGEL